jgi:heme A synthase
MESVFHFLEFLVGAVVVLVALCFALLVVVSRMPPENPLRQVMNLLLVRLGVTAATGALAIPIEPIPGLDVLYDVGAPLFLIYFWYTFFWQAGSIWSQRSPRAPTNPHSRS